MESLSSSAPNMLNMGSPMWQDEENNTADEGKFKLDPSALKPNSNRNNFKPLSPSQSY